jgi:acetate kinase
LDQTLNNQAQGEKESAINKADSRLKIFVIPTNEELLIARDTVRSIHKS